MDNGDRSPHWRLDRSWRQRSQGVFWRSIALGRVGACLLVREGEGRGEERESNREVVQSIKKKKKTLVNFSFNLVALLI